MKISACVVVRNEEKNIETCLKSFKDVVDEIIIVDGNSTDKTAQICRKYTDKIYFRQPQGFVEPDRQFALEKAAGDWVLVLDADEELTEELHDNLKNLTNQKEYAGYGIARRTYYDINCKKYTKHVCNPDYQLRFFKKDKIKYKGLIHEVPIGNNKIKNVNYYINHYVPNRYTYSFFKKHHLKYARIEAQQRGGKKYFSTFYYLKALVSFFYHTGECLLSQKWILDGFVGLKASVYMGGLYFFYVNYYTAKFSD